MKAFKGKAKLIPKYQVVYPLDSFPALVQVRKLVLDGISYDVQFIFATDYPALVKSRTAPKLLGFQIRTEVVSSDARQVVTG